MAALRTVDPRREPNKGDPRGPCGPSGYQRQSAHCSHLQSVGIGLRVERNEGLESLELPALKTVGDDGQLNSVYYNDNADLGEVDLPSLQAVTGAISLHQLPAAKAASFPALTDTGGFISIDHAESMTALDLSALPSLDALEVKHTALDQCTLEALAEKLGTSCDCYENAGACK